MSASPVARIEQLDQIEKDVIAILQSAGQVLQEISKDRPSQKQSDQMCQQVMQNIKSVDTKLSEQIRYLTQVSTGHPHEGSSYPSQKILQTAWHRLEHARSRVSELERIRGQATPILNAPAAASSTSAGSTGPTSTYNNAAQSSASSSSTYSTVSTSAPRPATSTSS